MKLKTKYSSITNATKQKIKEFGIFLVLTLIIYLLMELSKSYSSTVVFNVDYKNLPKNKIIQNKPVNSIEVAIKAPGFSLLKYKLWNKKLNLSLANMRKSNHKYIVYPNSQIAYLNSQLPNETAIVRVLTDTILIDLGENKIKKVPIIPSINLNFKLGFGLIKPITMHPDSVLITGAEKIIDSINEIKAAPIKLNNINKNINIEASLIIPSTLKNIKLNTTKVKIIGEVDKYTEGSFKLPVILINKPKNVMVKTVPDEIKVIFQSGLTNYPKINTKSVTVVFDYNQYKKDTLIQYLTPIVTQKSDLISSLKINPSQIQFFIQKQ
jgi:hypothetical protein